MASIEGFTEPETFDAFQNEEGDLQYIPGSQGLHCILEEINADPKTPDQERKRKNMCTILWPTEMMCNNMIKVNIDTVLKVRSSIQQLDTKAKWD
eukprot:15355414-Ditylum_brightwellii.AAC.1